MPRIIKTNPAHVELILAGVTREELAEALARIAYSALDARESGSDTCAVVYEELARLDIVVP
jgi:anthranilate phosphoribosyltransferase